MSVHYTIALQFCFYGPCVIIICGAHLLYALCACPEHFVEEGV